MLDDLTAEEVVALVQALKCIDENAMIFVDDTLTTLDNVPGMESLAHKINESGNREDVKAYLDEHYGS